MCFSRKTTVSVGTKIDRRKISGLPTDEVHTKALTIFIDECSKIFDRSKVETSVKSITVEWWNDVAPSPSTGVLNTVVVDNGQVYSGLTVGTLCKVAWRGKLFRSAFAHEMLHIIGRNLLNNEDAGHQEKSLWDLEATICKILSDNNL